jgi:hypothetical protein
VSRAKDKANKVEVGAVHCKWFKVIVWFVHQLKKELDGRCCGA